MNNPQYPIFQDPMQQHRELFQQNQLQFMPQIISPPQMTQQQMQQQQQWHQQQQLPQQQLPQQTQGLRCFPVNNRVEAESFTIDAFGVYVFPDLANKRIYTKQINDNGQAVINSYALETREEPPKEAIAVVPTTEDVLGTIKTELEEKILFLTEKLEKLELKVNDKEEVKNGHTGNNEPSAKTKSFK